jgi:hypothetical protein
MQVPQARKKGKRKESKCLWKTDFLLASISDKSIQLRTTCTNQQDEAILRRWQLEGGM